MPSKPWPPQNIKSPEPNVIIKISRAQKVIFKKEKNSHHRPCNCKSNYAKIEEYILQKIELISIHYLENINKRKYTKW